MQLKLYSDHARFNMCAKKSRQQIVQLVDEVTYLATWQVLAFHPQQRLEFEGLPVPVRLKHGIAFHLLPNDSCTVALEFERSKTFQ